MTHVVCRVRSTQAVSALEPGVHFARSAPCRLPRMRRATSAVVGPALPFAGLIPKRFWNLTIVAQSSGVCAPSTTIGQYEPIAASATSTSRCLSPTGQPGKAAAGGAGGALVGGALVGGAATTGATGSAASGVASGVSQDADTGSGPAPSLPGPATADAVPLDRTATTTATPRIQRRI